ncbi:hypothetical protein M378DRAFT_182381 [Amanita muscaria Koide BX008]|uniref:Uncharacterized protein n=1 Tax=Amanita muscaria (strain Koide BX008) TaxID=946122 RepID=A0A0C2SLV3_AMAMK|nr:hypothetical protein M378DRAFT_182381 [Amanita muscaria Koide BX008]
MRAPHWFSALPLPYQTNLVSDVYDFGGDCSLTTVKTSLVCCLAATKSDRRCVILFVIACITMMFHDQSRHCSVSIAWSTLAGCHKEFSPSGYTSHLNRTQNGLCISAYHYEIQQLEHANLTDALEHTDNVECSPIHNEEDYDDVHYGDEADVRSDDEDGVRSDDEDGTS